MEETEVGTFSLSVLSRSLFPRWIEAGRKGRIEPKAQREDILASSIPIVDELLRGPVGETGHPKAATDSPSRHSEDKSIHLTDNGELSRMGIFPQSRATGLFSPRPTGCLCIVWLTQSALAVAPSPSVSGHVCGGVVRRRPSRNTEAREPNGETFPNCSSETDLAICSCFAPRGF